MPTYKVNYKVGASERSIDIVAENLERAQNKIENKGLKWVDIIETNFKSSPRGIIPKK